MLIGEWVGDHVGEGGDGTCKCPEEGKPSECPSNREKGSVTTVREEVVKRWTGWRFRSSSHGVLNLTVRGGILFPVQYLWGVVSRGSVILQVALCIITSSADRNLSTRLCQTVNLSAPRSPKCVSIVAEMECLCPLPNLILSVMAFEVGVFGRWLGHPGGALMNGISVLIKETLGSSLLSSTMCGHSENMTVYEPGGRPSSEIKSDDALILDFPATRNVRSTHLFFINHTIWMDRAT